MIDDLCEGRSLSEITEHLCDFDVTLDIDSDIERTDIGMCNFVLLQVLHNAEESLREIPDFTFLVGEVDFLSLGDFDLQIVIVVLVQQAKSVEGWAEFVLFFCVVAHQLDEIRMVELRSEGSFTGDELEILFVLDCLVDSSELLLSCLAD